MVIVEAYHKTFALLIIKNVLISLDFEIKRKYISLLHIFFSKHLKSYATQLSETGRWHYLQKYCLGYAISFNSLNVFNKFWHRKQHSSSKILSQKTFNRATYWRKYWYQCIAGLIKATYRKLILVNEECFASLVFVRICYVSLLNQIYNHPMFYSNLGLKSLCSRECSLSSGYFE